MTCPDCHIPDNYNFHKPRSRRCCTEAPVVNGTQLQCIPNSMNPELECERENFQYDPETAMNAEIGLVYDFDVTEEGYPTGCPGIPSSFTGEKIKAGGNRGVQTPNCPQQMLAEPSTAKPVSEYVQDYANNRTMWLQ